MAGLLSWTVRNPYRSAILVGMIVAVAVGWVSFPREKTLEKTITDWLPDNAVPLGNARTELLDALQSYRAGERDGVKKVSEEHFRDLGLSQTHAAVDAEGDGREFRIQYVGRESPESETLYVAERRVLPASLWWSPDRWAYKAVEAEATGFGNVLRLTYERDLGGLLALLLADVIIGGIYAAIVGLILGVLGMEGLDKKHAPRQLPNPAPPTPMKPRPTFRA